MVDLINFLGAPGIGKTYLARKLSQKAGIYFFDRDIMYNEIFGDDRQSKHYKSINSPLTKSIWLLAIENAKKGVSNLIESPMTQAIQGKPASFIDDALEAAQQDDFLVTLIYCIAPEEVILANIKKRGYPRDEPKYKNWDEFAKTFINVPGPVYEHLKIDTTDPIKQNLETITNYLSR